MSHARCSFQKVRHKASFPSCRSTSESQAVCPCLGSTTQGRWVTNPARSPGGQLVHESSRTCWTAPHAAGSRSGDRSPIGQPKAISQGSSTHSTRGGVGRSSPAAPRRRRPLTPPLCPAAPTLVKRLMGGTLPTVLTVAIQDVVIGAVPVGSGLISHDIGTALGTAALTAGARLAWTLSSSGIQRRGPQHLRSYGPG